MRPEIQSINNKLRSNFPSRKSKNIKWRKRQLDKVKKFLENQKEIIDCMVADFGRFCSTNCTKYVWNLLKFILYASLFESMATEILSTVAEVDFSLIHLHSCTNPVFIAYPALLAPCNCDYAYEPYGISLIISPFNYSMHLAVRKFTTIPFNR